MLTAVVYDTDNSGKQAEVCRLTTERGRVVPSTKHPSGLFVLNRVLYDEQGRRVDRNSGDEFLRLMPAAYSGTRTRVGLEMDGTKGDLPGHPFRGNQWTGGGGGSGDVRSFRKDDEWNFVKRKDDAQRQAQDAYNWAMENWGDLGGKLSGDEKTAFGRYSGYSYLDMNAYLRGDKMSGAADVKNVEKDSKILADVLKREKAPDTVEVFRGVKMVDQEMFAPIPGFADKFEPGAVIEDKSFMSTSLSAGLARRFAGRADEGMLMKIVIPKGTPAAFRDSSEVEVMMPPGTKIRVTKKWVDDTGLTMVEAEVVQ